MATISSENRMGFSLGKGTKIAKVSSENMSPEFQAIRFNLLDSFGRQ